MGRLLAVCTSPAKGTEKVNIHEGDLIADWGLQGDAHAGHWHRQVSLLAYEKIEDFRKRGAEIHDGSFGENLIIEGWDLKTLDLGTRFQIGEAVRELTQVGKKCHHGCAIFQRMGDCIMPREGVFTRVIRGGHVKEGDEVVLLPPVKTPDQIRAETEADLIRMQAESAAAGREN